MLGGGILFDIDMVRKVTEENKDYWHNVEVEHIESEIMSAAKRGEKFVELDQISSKSAEHFRSLGFKVDNVSKLKPGCVRDEIIKTVISWKS